MRTSFSLSVLLLLVGGAAAQIKDTVKNRIKIAEQFLAENPVQDNVEAVARPQMAAIKSAEEVMLFKRNLEQVDYPKLHNIIRHNMIKHFTAPELEYMVEMYSHPLGRSMMAKMGAYTSEMTPKLHEALAPIVQSNAQYITDKMEKEVEHAERMQGEAPEVLNTAPQKAPEKLELPPNSIKVPDGVFTGSTINDVLKEQKEKKEKKIMAE